jgi:hypothetical protein
VTERHIRIHGKYREHDRYVVHDGRDDADRSVRKCRAHVDINDPGQYFEIADESQAADAEYDPIANK